MLISSQQGTATEQRSSTSEKASPTFIDLFCGIGGLRIGFERAGGRCVFSSEWDKLACKTYNANFGQEPAGDITKIPSRNIPHHDILLAGFPCQPFSIAGVVKKRSLNKPVGFKDLTQGTLFFDVARILHDKRPRTFLLENVRHLKTHDKGNTFRTITKTLTDELGYDIHHNIIDAKTLVPQHRERIYIVGFDRPTDFKFPVMPDRKPRIRNILEQNPDKKYTLTDHLWDYLQKYAAKHRALGNGFGFGLVDIDGYSRTLSARYFKDGSEILIPQGDGLNPRRLTPHECARLMGFPDTYKIVVSDTQAYKQFGNAVVVPVIEQLARSIIQSIQGNSKRITLRDYT